MRFYAQGALLFVLLGLGATRAASGQQKRAGWDGAQPVTATDKDRGQQPKTFSSRSLTPSEGLAILAVALETRHHASFPSDCSHLVHELYRRAGFPYQYASSSDLYAGIDEFRRVASPQPGDLAVWRGHAGIVVNPAQHSFFSALSSGRGVDSYDSPYWKQRGQPRFFRYIKLAPNGVLSTANRTASLKPTDFSRTEPHEAPAEDSASDRSEESASEAGSSAKLGGSQAMYSTNPPVPVVNFARPTCDQVGAAFFESFQGWGENLREHDLFNSAHPVTVFDRFEVRKVHIGGKITGNQDWVDVQIHELTSLGGKPDAHKRWERQRWGLRRRNNTSWELVPSTDTTYLPQPIAVRILAHELAQLTEDGSDAAADTQEKAELARLLDVLLGK
jgi:NlpC/P60 family